jgi:peptidoglycan/xylan/chitin deacetylase (PgdA/CDA1 family)
MAAGQLSGGAKRRARPAIQGVPVFLYHEIVDDSEFSRRPQTEKYSVITQQFRDQLAQIKNSCYEVRSVRDIAESPDCIGQDRLAGITFDDGCSSDYEKAFPLLLEAGLRADFFLNTANIGKPGYLNWEQIQEMQKLGMAFHSHGHSHVVLSTLDRRAVERELGTSRKILEDKLGCSVDFLAAPYGLLNRRVIREAFRLGYRGVCNSRQWTARVGNRCINRVAVFRQTSPAEFRRLLQRHPVPYVIRSLRSAIFYLPRQILLRIQPAQLGVQVLEKQG